jgi:hypothetical protein
VLVSVPGHPVRSVPHEPLLRQRRPEPRAENAPGAHISVRGPAYGKGARPQRPGHPACTHSMLRRIQDHPAVRLRREDVEPSRDICTDHREQDLLQRRFGDRDPQSELDQDPRHLVVRRDDVRCPIRAGDGYGTPQAEDRCELEHQIRRPDDFYRVTLRLDQHAGGTGCVRVGRLRFAVGRGDRNLDSRKRHGGYVVRGWPCGDPRQERQDQRPHPCVYQRQQRAPVRQHERQCARRRPRVIELLSGGDDHIQQPEHGVAGRAHR